MTDPASTRPTTPFLASDYVIAVWPCDHGGVKVEPGPAKPGYRCAECGATAETYVRSSIGTNGIHGPTIQWVVEWLRGDDGEECRVLADMQGVPAEDTLAAALERRWLT